MIHQAGPAPGISKRVKWAILIFAFVLVVGTITWLFIWKQGVVREEELARKQIAEEQAREARLNTELTALRAQFPKRKFALYKPATYFDDGRLRLLKVDRIVFSRDGSKGFSATVTFTSIAAQRIAPTIYVSLFDEKGVLIDRGGVVDHVLADLRPGGSDETEDKMYCPYELTPAFVSIEDESKLGER